MKNLTNAQNVTTLVLNSQNLNDTSGTIYSPNNYSVKNVKIFFERDKTSNLI